MAGKSSTRRGGAGVAPVGDGLQAINRDIWDEGSASDAESARVRSILSAKPRALWISILASVPYRRYLVEASGLSGP